MLEREQAEERPHRPPPALPDGSMPTYGGHPLPGTPGGGPSLSVFGWGHDFTGRGASLAGESRRTRRVRIGLITGLLVVAGAALAMLIFVLTSRTGLSADPPPDASQRVVVQLVASSDPVGRLGG